MADIRQQREEERQRRRQQQQLLRKQQEEARNEKRKLREELSVQEELDHDLRRLSHKDILLDSSGQEILLAEKERDKGKKIGIENIRNEKEKNRLLEEEKRWVGNKIYL